MIKCNRSKNILSLIFLCMASLLYASSASSQHINILFNDSAILDAHNTAEVKKAITLLLKENLSGNIEEIHIEVDCQDQQNYLDDIADVRRTITRGNKDQRDIWLIIEISSQPMKPLQECIDHIFMDTINNNYQLYEAKIFPKRQSYDASTILQSPSSSEKTFHFFSFISNNLKSQSDRSNENSNFSFNGIQVLQQGSGSVEIILILAVGVLAVLGFGVFIFLKKRKNNSNVQRNDENQKFISRTQGSFDSRLDQSKSSTSFNEGGISQKRTLPATNTEDLNQVLPKLFTPNFKGTSLKLDDKMLVINDNMFNHIDTPKSVEDLGSKEMKETPKGVDFNIEFSIVESDPKGSVTRS